MEKRREIALRRFMDDKGISALCPRYNIQLRTFSAKMSREFLLSPVRSFDPQYRTRAGLRPVQARLPVRANLGNADNRVPCIPEQQIHRLAPRL
jgi:hypothetical protein